jgi:hypothetical protein
VLLAKKKGAANHFPALSTTESHTNQTATLGDASNSIRTRTVPESGVHTAIPLTGGSAERRRAHLRRRRRSGPSPWGPDRARRRRARFQSRRNQEEEDCTRLARAKSYGRIAALVWAFGPSGARGGGYLSAPLRDSENGTVSNSDEGPPVSDGTGAEQP